MKKNRVGKYFVHVHPFAKFSVDTHVDVMGVISRAKGENASE
jgi:hypothetical protein